MKRSLIIKMLAGVIAVAVFGFLFMRSLEDARAEPYTVESRHLRNWTLSLEPASKPNQPLLVLRPPAEFAAGLFRQVFARAMESLNAPVAPALPIVLRGEFDRVVGDQMTQEALIAAARAAGMETTTIVPRCLVHRRLSEPGNTRQAYFVYFDAPAIARFREQLALESAALSPVLFVAGAGGGFDLWLPQRVEPDRDCVASIDMSK